MRGRIYSGHTHILTDAVELPLLMHQFRQGDQHLLQVGVDSLRNKHSVHEISPETEATPVPQGPWSEHHYTLSPSALQQQAGINILMTGSTLLGHRAFTLVVNGCLQSGKGSVHHIEYITGVFSVELLHFFR